MCLHLIVVPKDLIPASLVVSNSFHDCSIDVASAYILNGGLQRSEHPLAHIHSVVDLACPLNSMIPHVSNSAFPMVPCVLQMLLYHLLYA
jgi:hypothetical protein